MKLPAKLAAGTALAILIGCSTSDTGVADVLLVASVEVTPASSDVLLGSTRQLEATAKTSGGIAVPGRTVVWSSSNPSIASVSSSGLVTGVALGGPVQIQATVDGVTGEAQVTVRPVPVDHVVVTPGQTGLLVGQTLPLTAIALDASDRPLAGRTFSWQSSAPEIASVTTSGLVLGVSQGGPVTITATSEGKSGTASVSVATRPATQLAFVQQPGPSVAGQTLNPAVKVALQDDLLSTVVGAGNVVTIALAANPGGATLSGTTQASAVNGIVTFADLVLNRVGTGYTFLVTSPGLTSATSSPFAVSAGTASKLAITTQPPGLAESGQLLTPQPVVQLQDVAGNAASQAGVAVTAAIASGTGSLAGTTTVTTNSAGTATFTNLAIIGATGSVTLGFSSAGLTGVTSSAIVLTAGAPAALSITTQPTSSAQNGVPLSQQPAIQLRDLAGNPVARAGIVVSAALATGSGTLGGATSATTDGSGLAAFQSLAINGVAGIYTLRFTSPGLTAVVSASIVLGAGAPSQLAIVTQPSSSARSGQAFTQQPSVQLRDGSGNPVSVAGVSVTAAVSTGGSLTGTATITTNASGVAGFTDLAISGLAGQYTLTFSSSGLTPATSAAITLGAGTATRLGITTQPSAAAQSGAAFLQQPVIQLRDAPGNPVAQAGVVVTAALASGPTGGTLGGTTTATTGSTGAATFTNLAITGPTGTYTIRFTASGLTAVVSSGVALGAGAARTIVANSATSQSATAGTAVGAPPSVKVTDASGNPVQGFGVTFTVTAGGGTTVPASPAVINTDAAGVATLTSWTLGPAAGSGNNSLTAGATGLTGSPVTFTASATVGAARTLAANSATSQSATVGTAVGAPPSAKVTDATGNPVSGVAVTFTVTAGAGSLVPASPAVVSTNASGIATVTSWTLGPAAGTSNNTVTATATGLAGSPVTFTASGTTGTATTIAANSATAQSATAGSAVAAPPSVRVTDAGGNPVPAVAVTFTVTGGGGTSTPASPAVVSTNASGIATLTAWTLGPTAGVNNNTLTASASGLSGSPVTFTASATAGTARTIAANSSTSQSATVGTAVGAPPSVRVTDAGGNAVSGVAVTFTVTSGGGTSVPASPATVSTNASGIASLTSWTLGPAAGTNNNTLTAAASGLTGSPVTFTASGTAGSANRISILTQPSSTVQNGVAFPQPPVLQLRDQLDNPVSQPGVMIGVFVGSGLAASFDPATATTDGNGQAAFTGLRMTGAVGTRTLLFAASGFSSVSSNSVTLTTGPASGIAANSSVSQSATAGTAVGAPPSVRVTDTGGNPVAGVAVTFTVTAGGGTSSPASPAVITTNASGVATLTSWTLGPAAGSNNNTVTAAATGLTGSPVTFTASGTAGAAAIVVANSATSQSATVGTQVAAPPSVKVTDATGNPVGGFAVAFAVTAGGGSVVPASPATVSTNALGIATATSWTLGPTAGTGNNTVTATASGLSGSPVTFTASGTTGTATTISANSAVSQSTTVGTAVGAPPSVTVTDGSGNPVAGVSVTFTLTAGGGSIVPASPAVITTNASGTATLTSWTLGPTAGTNNNTVTAAASGLSGSPVTFTASGTAGAATTIAANSATSQSATAGTAVGAPPSVRVTDGGGNPVAGVSVTFTVTGGGGTTSPASPAVITTNASGVAALTSWTLGPTAGTNNNTVTAAATGLSGSPVTFTASGTTGAATTIAANSATSQSATAGTAVGAPPSVTVTDASGNPVPGVSVTFTVTGGGGTTSPASPAVITTNASGIASLTSWTLGPSAGSNNNTVTAAASGLGGSPVTFTASGLAGAADHLTITTQPSSTAAAGSPFPQQPALQLRDASGNAVSQGGVGVTASIASGPAGATLGGTTTVPTGGAGGAAFTDLSITGLAGDYTLRFDATGLAGAISGTITITAVSPSRVGIITQPPSNAANGAAMSPAPVVQLQDAGGNPVPSAGVPITISIASGSGSLDGTTTVNTDALGRATFSGVAIIGTAGNFTLGFSSTGLTGATSNTVVLGPGAATQLTITTQPSATTQNNTVFAQQPVIQLLDSGGNPVGQAGVTVSADLTSGTGPLAGDRSVTTDASGVATFTNLKIQSPGTYTIRFTSGSLTPVVSSAIVVN